MDTAYSDRDLIHIIAIIRALHDAQRFLGDMTLEEFETDDEKQNAVAMAFARCGEHVKRLSEEFRRHESSIEWRKVAGMRDWITHNYDGLDFETLYHAVIDQAPQVLDVLLPYADQASNERIQVADPFDVPNIDETPR
ncbi:HepT-like ribonuclease domain-containing protein [Bifidobacterium eulemuris]|uniref:DUF86 domain-containing protein n=1 Tax=Bifidobacterium eulemuris TaxID=1765219 RepID=A0A261GDR0_9BIFI|nr:HepT-like ribonuclease domain-containing protein [Bifidobacterium eulemuris]OZG69106.1 hypothetical protein BEUL_0512 [Bifidobacterium eulemuris]QOL31375.1 DUF86 domain-containing protein [Bifidobacterium eulemuris]